MKTQEMTKEQLISELLELRREKIYLKWLNKNNEEKFIASERELFNFTKSIENSDSIIYITNNKGNIQYVNAQCSEISGYSKEELIGNNPRIFKSYDTSDKIYKEFYQTINSGNIWRGEFQNKTKSGEFYYVSCTVSPIFNNEGIITHFLALQVDISKLKQAESEIYDLNTNLENKIVFRTTDLNNSNELLLQEIEERKRIERELFESENNYKSVVENIKEVIFKTDTKGLWLFLNKAWEEITGFSINESIGQVFINYVHPDDRQRNMELFEPLILRQKDYCKHEIRYLTKDGGYKWIEVFARLGINEQNEIIGTYGTLSDITEDKKIEHELELQRTRLKDILEGTNVGTWEWNIQTGETMFNERWANILGYTLSEISPININTWLKYAHPDDLKESDILLQKHFNGESDYYSFESRMMHKNGHWVWVLDRGRVNKWDDNGKPLLMSGTHQEITENKLMLEDLIESRETHRGLSEAAFDSIFFSEKGICIEQNQTARMVFGYTDEEAIGRYGTEWIVPEERPKVMKNMLEGYEKPYEVTAIRKDGSTFPCMLSGKMMFYKGRNVRVTSLNDISKLKDIENALKTIEVKFSLIMDLLPALVFIKDSKSRMIYCNRAMDKALGSSKWIDKPLSDLFDPFITKRILEDDKEAFNQGHITIEESFVTLDGTIHDYETQKFSIQEFGHENLLGGIAIDITDRKKAESEMLIAKNEAQQANIAKSDFLSRMSHELRTPLNSILGFAQLMEMTKLNDQQQKGISHILKSGRHLLGLINEVLDISRIEAGHIDLSIEPVKIYDMLEDIVLSLQPLANKRDISFKLEEEIDQSVIILADLQRLNQVLLNLINNAIKYNKINGSIIVTYHISDKNESAIPMVRVEIKDTGIGISKNNIENIFKPFERIESNDSITEGTGLGLAVAKQLTTLMNGTIGVVSKPNKGSTFWIELPLCLNCNNSNNLNAISNYDQKLNMLSNSVILYIEDNISNIELIEQILLTKRPGTELISTFFGKEAVNLAIQHKPNMILLDLNLPDIHGLKVLENLKKEDLTKNIPVVILSADALPKQIEELKNNGADNYLTKPLDINLFLTELNKY